ncbi:outer membrane protein OmpA-like peptidoglycan-associated protein [Cytobacillus eiseniae]|uniref:Outer membrane protein OmpA-like peptidoglycan-associated protein n=1 Tax=Cytobacillus eiseniae TaxID=762947 RepID=A0ABS4RFR9_9BACI|nr:OmpA family protein [Cytobacillus eiseniae]MBP2241752.1 outer membrane protein OmpA-like peptidoglycan-associated protein [Cytobacillus eiseniae]
MKSYQVIFSLICIVFFLVGCSEKNQELSGEEQSSNTEEVGKETLEESEDGDSQFKPGTFTPGTFEPGTFTPGTFTPGTFEPGTFIPGTFTPGNFDSSVTVSVEEDEIVIEVPSHLLFDFDKSELKSSVIHTLDQLSHDLNEYEGANVWIHGHTDSQGNTDYNQTLSEERARAVQSYLEKTVDGEKVNLEAKGFGQTKSISSNDTEEGREQNRRVEIIVEPLVKK